VGGDGGLQTDGGVLCDEATCTAPAPSTAACVDGRCIVTLALTTHPNRVLVDSTSVYWTTAADPGEVMKIPKAGGEPVTLASGQPTPSQIVQDDQNLYWRCFDAFCLKRISKQGGAVATLATGVMGAEAIAIDSTNLYWVDGPSMDAMAVFSMPLAGGSVSTLSSPQFAGLGRMVTDGTALYFGPGDRPGSVVQLPVTGGTPITLGESQWRTGGIAVGTQDVFWSDQAFVYSAPIDIGGMNLFVSGTLEQNSPGDVEIFGSDLFWVDWGLGSVATVPLSGGTPVTLFTGTTSDHPGCVAIDESAVYWSAGDANELRMLRR
jgi:hypothetical protein